MASVYSPATMNCCAYLDRGGMPWNGTHGYNSIILPKAYHEVEKLKVER